MSKIVDRIRKLIALATNNSSPAEGASAMSKARDMIKTHGVDPSLFGLTVEGFVVPPPIRPRSTFVPPDTSPPRTNRDWHMKRSPDEPDCGPHQWRSKDRYVVHNIVDMDDRHLNHCMRFARTKPQHSSKLFELTREAARRDAGRQIRGEREKLSGWEDPQHWEED